MISCPGNIVKETTANRIRIFWDEPVYTDNCGKSCSIAVVSSVSSGTEFIAGSINTVRYAARDPSGNRNDECVFTVKVNKKGTQID